MELPEDGADEAETGQSIS